MTTPQTAANGKGLWAEDLIKVILAIVSITFSVIFYREGFSEGGMRLAIRWSAKYSFMLFALAFAASGIHLWFRQSFSYWLRMNRKYLGISFALVHLIHLFCLGILQAYFHPVFQKAAAFSLFSGGMAYFFTILMLITSFPAGARQVSPTRWKMLHTFGGYWILVIFSSSYIKRTLNDWSYWPYVLVIVLVLAFRYWAWQQKAS